MKIIVGVAVLSVPLFLAGCVTYPATVNGAPATVVQPAPVVVQPAPVVYEPYPVLEGGSTILIDPEDYYYVVGGVYYHHYYLSNVDVVVNRVPPGYHFLHGRFDVGRVPQKYFRHHLEAHPKAVHRPPVKRELEKKKREELR